MIIYLLRRQTVLVIDLEIWCKKQEISDFQRMNQSEYAPHTTKRMHESEFVFY